MEPRSVLARARDRWARVKLELPVIVRDLASDLLDRLGRPVVHLPIPPRRLRAAVGLTSAREEYLQAGAVGAIEIIGAFHRFAISSRSYPCWLDFGSGAGRLSRYLGLSGLCDELIGADIDEEAIAWAACNLPARRFLTSKPLPPLPLPAESVDVVVAASVFTHLAEEPQLQWLAELARLLRPGGLLLASTHSGDLLAKRGEVTEARLEDFRRRGFAFLQGRGPFNDDGAYHSRQYLEATWSRFLGPRGYVERGLFQSQDLSVWEKV